MSYQRIKTPKLYIDNINWLLSQGKMASTDITSSGASMLAGSSIHEFFDMKPSNLQTIDCGGASAGFKLKIDTTIGTDATQDSNFIAILGHNLKSAGAKISVQIDDDINFGSPQGNGDILSMTDIVNFDIQANVDTLTNIAEDLTTSETGITVQSGHGDRFSEGDFIKINNEIMYVDSVSGDVLTVDRASTDTTATTHSNGDSIFFTGYSAPQLNGWSLASFNATSDNKCIRLIIDPDGSANDNFSADVQIGAIIIGEMHEFPSSPDLDIKKKFLYDGVKKQTSMGGQTYSHATYLKGANWFLEPFANASSASAGLHTKTGRLALDMGFSYLQDNVVYSAEYFGRGETQASNQLLPNLVHKTHAGMLPMLLQYDKDTATANDSFLWCRLNNEPSFTQVANEVWSTKLSFLEEF
tara:strand:+ start:4508 stop:5746 length:1239 start_codon:yes stop_codon:yes gene_type:complete